MYIEIETTSRRKQLKELLRICLFAGAGLWIFGGLGHTIDLFRYYGAEKWPRVKGNVVESRIATYGSGVKYCSRPIILYEYEFEGKYHTSDKWGFPFFGCSSSSVASSISSSYKLNEEIFAYVKPGSGIAVLRPGQFYLWLITFMGLSCCTIIWIIRPKKMEDSP